MKTAIPLLVMTAILASGCGQSTPDPGAINTAIAQTQAAQQPAAAPQQAAGATNTPRPSPTPRPPTPTSVPTEAPSTDDLWAKNYVGSVESGGVIVEIARVLVGYKATMPSKRFEELDDVIDGWSDSDVVGELVFKITNNSPVTASIYPDQGTVQIGSEQIDLADFMFAATFGDDLGGEIFPGVTKIGGIWFAIDRSTPAEVTQLVYRVSAPYDSDSYADLGPAITITIDVPTHSWEEMPEELQ